jgi:hypothetical protein
MKKVSLAGLALCIAIMAVHAQQINLNEGLVAYYPFNGNANDESGNGNHGTVNGATLTADRLGNLNGAYHFGGVDNPSHIQIKSSSSLDFDSKATYSFFVKLNNERGMDGYGRSVASGTHCLFAKDHDRSGYAGMIGSSENGAWISINSFNNIQGNIQNSSERLNDGRWRHVVYVFDGNVSKIYLDGVFLARSEYSGNIKIGNGRDLFFGKFSSNWYPLDGVLDDIRIYNRALNQQEIRTLYGEEVTDIITPSSDLSSSIVTLDKPFEIKGKIGKSEYVSSATLFKKKSVLNISMFARYRNVHFINSTFFNSLDEGIITNNGGIELGFGKMYYPIEIEINGFLNFFKVDAGSAILPDQSISHTGMEFMMNYFVLPYISGVSKWFHPYLGAGYQTSSIAVSESSENSKKAESSQEISLGTGGWIIKGGVRLYTSKHFFFMGEYKQTFPVNSEKLFRAWNVGIGFTL